MTGTAEHLPVGRLRVLGTSDVHMNLTGFDYYSDAESSGLGLTRTATLISQARKEAADLGMTTILLDNGDWLQGTPLADVAISDQLEPHPACIAFRHLDYAAVALGNHEFNYGLEKLRQVIAQIPCPVVCSNLTEREPGLELGFQPNLILTKAISQGADLPPLTIGLFSTVPPQSMKWDAGHLSGKIEIGDAVATAKFNIAALKDAGCDVIIAMAHTGVGSNQAREGMENALVPLSRLPGLDAVIGGHSHLLLPQPNAENCPAADLPIPAFIPGSAGSHLGVIDLTFSFDGVRWQKQDKGSTELRPIHRAKIGPVKEDAVLLEQLAPAHLATRRAMAKPMGRTPHNLHSYFTFFDTDRSMELVAQAQAKAAITHLAATQWSDLPVLSALAPSKFGGRAGPLSYTDVPAGEICLRNVADLYIYPNKLRAKRVSGAVLREWLEMSAGFFNQLKVATPSQTLGDGARVGHNFDSIFGLSYKIDPRQPCRYNAEGQLLSHEHERIVDLCWDNRPVLPEQEFIVVTNSYRADGGGNFTMLAGSPEVDLPDVMIRDVLQDLVQSGTWPETSPLKSGSPWRFTGNMGLDVLTYTGPGALKYEHELPGSATFTGHKSSDGFVELRLTL